MSLKRINNRGSWSSFTTFPHLISIGFIRPSLTFTALQGSYILLISGWTWRIQSGSLIDWERKRKREKGKGEELEEVVGYGRVGKAVSRSHLNVVLLYHHSFADSTHSYDFLLFLSFHSPLRYLILLLYSSHLTPFW